MSLPATLTLPQRPPSMPNSNELVEQTRGHTAQVFQAVATAYLAFRREYYHETQPSLATIPPARAEIRQVELALLAESTLRVTPPGNQIDLDRRRRCAAL
jgi:hypothetical protein